MEPVIKKSPYHHVLLMRDDKEIISFKVHSRVLRYSLIGGILLIAFGIAGTVFGVKSWQKNHSLKARYESLSIELADARVQLEQLSNLQSLIATCDLPAPVFKFNEIQLPPENGESPSQEGQAATDADQTPAGNGETDDTQGEPNATKQTSDNDAMQEKVDQTTEPETGKATGQGDENPGGSPSTLPITHATSPVSINNLSSKNAGQDRIQMSFDLVANKPEAFVRGETSYEIELHDGAKHKIVPNFQDDTRFAISHMKNFDLTANLPKGITGQQIKNVIVHIALDSGEVFTSSYPFAQ